MSRSSPLLPLFLVQSSLYQVGYSVGKGLCDLFSEVGSISSNQQSQTKTLLPTPVMQLVVYFVNPSTSPLVIDPNWHNQGEDYLGLQTLDHNLQSSEIECDVF